MKSVTENILVMRYRFIGDTVLTIPFLRNLRHAEPQAYIAWMVAPGSSDVVKGIPYVNEMIYWDPVTIHADSRGSHRTLFSKIAFLKDLRQHHFDKVYVLKRSLSSAILAWLSGAPKRIGFDTEFRGLLLTTKVPYRHDQHEVKNFLDVLKADGVTVEDDYLEIWTSPAEEERLARILTDAGVTPLKRIAAIHPFSAVPQRGWPLENYAELAARLRKETNFSTLIIGGPGDVEAFGAIKHMFADNVTDLVGKCNLRETIALLRRCSLFVGNDSGIMHLAAAAGTPLVALFGPQSPVKFGPWSTRAKVIYKAMACSPCRQKFFSECEPSARMRPACMEAISVDEVFQESVRISGSALNKSPALL
ncbi:MAG TPA: lipopolysaccharide heptosyltransferase II [Nitrospirota bacterium]|nr:lipopolysaccharide heptosyltransferase II [Nitrospirota bacterium]